MRAAALLARIGYGALFVVALPLMLIGWARGAAAVVTLPAVHVPLPGWIAVGLGVILIGAGAWQLVRRGGGLPMNAFPPPRLVRTGLYRWVRNPMYLGFGIICAGAAIATGSAAGLWLVTPMTWLGMAALVFGYERHDLERRLGPNALSTPLLSLPPGDDARPAWTSRAAVYLWVLLPWLVTYFAVQALGPAPDAFQLITRWERNWPVWQWAEIPYASAYLFIPLTPLVLASGRSLRRFAIQGILATVVVGLIWVLVPVVAANRPFVPAGAAGDLLAFEQGSSRGVAAFPAFHVLWALIAGQAWWAGAGGPRARSAGVLWAVLVVLGSLATGHHTLIEGAAAVLLWLVLARQDRTWELVRSATERVANSWREWRLGPVRLINHGFWAGFGAMLGLLVAGMAAGPEHLGAIVWVGICVLLGAGLWAQWLEGSSRLLRPFGWYGGLVGGVLGIGSAALAGGAPLRLLLASYSLAAPWIQIFGRMRCLVQGCCHGAETTPAAGIRYRHRRSRVTALAGLAGVPVHATPLYSIAGNLVTAAVLFRLWYLGASLGLVLGVYFLMTGLARFVEESYRGEPQTPVVGGLRLYQWFAVLSVLAGIGCTMLPLTPSPGTLAALTGPLLIAALVMGLVTTAAMGLDFPASNRRFSRLAPAD